MKFQFHYGSIKILSDDVLNVDIVYFNSTMVRLKFDELQKLDKIIEISIPLWFD